MPHEPPDIALGIIVINLFGPIPQDTVFDELLDLGRIPLEQRWQQYL